MYQWEPTHYTACATYPSTYICMTWNQCSDEIRTEFLDKILKRVMVYVYRHAIQFLAPIKCGFLKSSFAGYKTTYKREPNCSTQVKGQVGYLTNDLAWNGILNSSRGRVIQNENSCETIHSHDKARGVAPFSHGEASQPHTHPFLAYTCPCRPPLP